MIRHLRQASFMMLSENNVLGGIISRNATPYERFHCDGQLSEHIIDCRKNDGYFKSLDNPPHEGYCSRLATVKGRAPFRFRTNPDWADMQCDNNATANDRPMLVILQGGTHQNVNATEYWQKFVIPRIKSPNFQACHRQGRIRLISVSLHFWKYFVMKSEISVC